MTNSYCAVMCQTASGQSRIFAVDATDQAAGDFPMQSDNYSELVDVITGNSLGDSLQGQTIVKAMATCENFTNSPGGIIFIDNQNNIIGSVSASQPEQQTPKWTDVKIPVALNYTCKVVTSAAVIV